MGKRTGKIVLDRIFNPYVPPGLMFVLFQNGTGLGTRFLMSRSRQISPVPRVKVPATIRSSIAPGNWRFIKGRPAPLSVQKEMRAFPADILIPSWRTNNLLSYCRWQVEMSALVWSSCTILIKRSRYRRNRSLYCAPLPIKPVIRFRMRVCCS